MESEQPVPTPVSEKTPNRFQRIWRMKITQFCWKWGKKLAFWFLIGSVGLTVLYIVLPVPCTPLMFKRLFEQMGDDKRDVRW